MILGRFHYRSAASVTKRDQRGYALIVIMFIMTALVIASLAAAPRMIQQVHRDREEEMIHRGVQYSRAIKKYYKKFGSYPASLQQLESANNNKFLRKHYKDPFSQDGEWKLVHFGEVQFTSTAGIAGGANIGIAASQLAAASQMSGASAAQLGAAAAALGAAGGFQGGPGGLGASTGGMGGPGGLSSTPSAFGGAGGISSSPGGLGATTGLGMSNQSNSGTTGTTGSTNSTSASTFGAQPMGGGAIIGVSSTSSKESVRQIDGKNHYKDWKFVYDPSLDRNGVLMTGPYNTKLAKLMATVNVNQGQQLGQPIGANGIGNGNNSSFGQTNFNQNGFGQQGLGQNSFGQQAPGSLGQGYAPPQQPVR